MASPRPSAATPRRRHRRPPERRRDRDGRGTPRAAGARDDARRSKDAHQGARPARSIGHSDSRRRAGARTKAPGGADSTAAGEPPGQKESGSSDLGQTIVRAFGITLGALFALIEILLLAFFILAAGDGWEEKLRRASRSAEQCEVALDTVREIRRVVLRYLLVNVVINAAQAILVGLVVWALGYAGPIVWGMLTFIAEFVPYFGGAVMVGLLFLTGLAAGQGFGHAVLAPAAYLIISTLQNNLVSPAAYGRGLRLNPTAILIGVIFWGLVWGIAGVFLAVPLLAIIRIIAERNDALAPAAAFLAD
jgi:predicted PurR-regulated permease PerM